MKKALLVLFLLLLIIMVHSSCSFAWPAEDVHLVTDAQYFQTAMTMIRQAKRSIHVIMFEMAYYEEHPNSPSNLLIRELISSRKRGVKVDVILEVREEADRTSTRNRRSGKILAEGGVTVIYDPFFKTTHAKVMVVDGQLTLLGSTNWTYPALTSNNEVSLLLRSRELAEALTDYFNRVRGSGSNP